MRSVASAALTLPSATCPARSWSSCTRWTTAGLPIFARWPLISCDSIGADRPSTPARRAWLRPRSSMSLRKSAPNGSPYQFRCSSRALAVASCCAASIASPHRFPEPVGSLERTTPSILRRVVGHGDPQSFAESPGDPVLWSRTPAGICSSWWTHSLRGLSSVGRALSLHGRCQGFDSPRLHREDPHLRKRGVRGLVSRETTRRDREQFLCPAASLAPFLVPTVPAVLTVSFRG